MVLTSRRKRPLDRKIPHLRDARLIIIAAEGEKTEKQYFESDIFRCKRVQVRVLETHEGFSAPKHVLKRLKEFAKTTELQPDDQLWLMVDKDRWKDQALSDVCSSAIRGRKQKAQLAISNPSFELWLFLHHADWTQGPVNSASLETELRSLLRNYNKAKLVIENFRPHIHDAINRARMMDNQPQLRWPVNPGTHVYKVAQAILEM